MSYGTGPWRHSNIKKDTRKWLPQILGFLLIVSKKNVIIQEHVRVCHGPPWTPAVDTLQSHPLEATTSVTNKVEIFKYRMYLRSAKLWCSSFIICYCHIIGARKNAPVDMPELARVNFKIQIHFKNCERIILGRPFA